MDHIDQILAQWQKERPDLDTWPMAPIGRMYRLFHHLAGEIEKVHKQGGLKTGEFDDPASERCALPTDSNGLISVGNA